MNRDLLSWLTFLTLISVIVLAVNTYIGFRLAGSFLPGSPWRIMIWSLIVGCAGIVVMAPFLRYFGSKISEPLSRVLLFFGYSYLGVMAVMVFILLAADLLLCFFNFLGSRGIATELFNESRRSFLFAYGPWAALGVTGALSIKGYQTASKGPSVVPVTINKKGLHNGLHGIKIAQISDLHVSSTITRDFVQNVVTKTMELEPDIILLTGDMVDGSYEALKDDVEPLRQLKAPFGVYYITGNHEYYWGHEDWEKVFTGFEFKVLHNRNEVVEIKGASLAVAGVPDFTYENFKLGKVDPTVAFSGLENKDFVVFMVHQPEGYKLIKNFPCDLQVSGHTHAGQFFPISLLIGLFHKYAKGLYRHEDKFWVYVNPGTGYWGPINRLGVPSEITLFTLQA